MCRYATFDSDCGDTRTDRSVGATKTEFPHQNHRVYAISRPENKIKFPAQLFCKGDSASMAKLTAATRKKLPKSDFADEAARKYPIEDAAHARDALARSSGKPEH